MFAEFRFAARALARWRGGAVAAVVTLAVGIGLTTALSALVRVLLADLPGVPELDRLARVYASNQTLGVERSAVALHECDASLSTARSFDAIGGYADQDATIGTGSGVRPVIAGYASPGFFRAMAVPPAAGRVFTAADVDAARPVVIVSNALWRREFQGGDLSNATLVVDGVTRAIVGVMPPEFSYDFVGIGADLWVPLARAGQNTPAIVTVYARLRGGIGWPAANAELAQLGRGHDPWTWRAIPVADDARRRASGAYGFTLGPAALVLLIACVNVACMLMTRGLARDRELSVRRALGATRGRVIRLLLAENLVLAAVGGAAGAALAAAILRGIDAALVTLQPALAGRLTAGPGVLPIALGCSVLACVIFGTAPACRLSRRDVAGPLNGVPAPVRVEIAGYGARDAIVFAEVASAVGLMVWTAMLFGLFAQLRAIAFTFPADRVVAMRVPGLHINDVAARVAAIPGIASVATSSGMLGGRSPVRAVADGMAPVVMSRVPVGAGFFETLGVPLVQGRGFDASELRGLDGVLVLSQSAAAKLAPGGNALGMRLRLGGGPPSVVIGVCRDAIDYGALSRAAAFAPPEVYAPYQPSVMEGVVLARVSGDAHAALRAIAAAAPARPGARAPRPVVLSDEIGARRSDGGFLFAQVLSGFAVLTLLLAASGIVAVVSQSVAQRTREFGIRLALGASPRNLLAMVLARETKLIGSAVATGVVFAMAGTSALFVELAALSMVAPSRWIAAVALSGGVAALSVLLATRRIVRLEPGSVLRRS